MDPQDLYNILKSPQETEKLLKDSKTTASALITIKYGIIESKKDSLALSRSLKACCFLLNKDPAIWALVQSSLIEKIFRIAGEQCDNKQVLLNITCPSLSILTIIILESHKKKFFSRAEPLNLLGNLISNNLKVLERIISRLLSNHIEIVLATFQLISSLLLSKDVLEKNGIDIYSIFRICNLTKIMEEVYLSRSSFEEYKSILDDLQNLLFSARKVNRTKKGRLELPHHQHIIRTIKKGLDSLVGPINDMNSIRDKKEHHDIIQGDENLLIDYINSIGGWSACLDLYDLLQYDNLTLVKNYAEVFTVSDNSFPLVRASIEVSNALFKIFDIYNYRLPRELENGVTESLRPPSYVSERGTISSISIRSNSSDNPSHIFLNWSTLHFIGVMNFMRMWKSSSAILEDIENISTLIRSLFKKAMELNDNINDVVREMNNTTYKAVREYQVEQLDAKLIKRWETDINYLREKYLAESRSLVREQRIRLLLNGDSFWLLNPINISLYNQRLTDPAFSNGFTSPPVFNASENPKYFVMLSPSKHSIEYKQLSSQPNKEGNVNYIDLSNLHEVKVVPLSSTLPTRTGKSSNTVTLQSRISYAKVLLLDKKDASKPLLTLYCGTMNKANIWRDGLMMLKDREFQSSYSREHVELLAERKLGLQLMTLGPNDYTIGCDFSGIRDLDFAILSTNYYYQ